MAKPGSDLIFGLVVSIFVVFICGVLLWRSDLQVNEVIQNYYLIDGALTVHDKTRTVYFRLQIANPGSKKILGVSVSSFVAFILLGVSVI